MVHYDKKMHIHTKDLKILCGKDFEECNSTPYFSSDLVDCKECKEIASRE